MRLARSLSNTLNVFLTGRLRAYLDILVVGSGARMFGLASQFVVLIMLSRFLSKESFGDLMTAYGFYRLAGLALGVGGSLVLLFHVSRHRDDRAAEIRLQRFSAWWAQFLRRRSRSSQSARPIPSPRRLASRRLLIGCSSSRRF